MAITPLLRTMGIYTISIATSLAVEAITHTGEFVDIGRERNEPKPPVLNIQHIMLNIRTMTRNAVNAFGTEYFDRLNDDVVYASVIADIAGFRSVVHKANPGCTVEVYACTYRSIGKLLPAAKFKQHETDKQKRMIELENAVFDRYYKEHPEDITQFDTQPASKKPSVLLTHYPVDLLAKYNFPSMLLLESHTGVIKSERAWPTKLNMDRKIKVIPFNRVTLSIFGDGVIIAPQEIKVRRTLVKIGEKRNWNAMTTVSRMLSDVKLEYEPHLHDYMRRANASGVLG